MNVFKKWFQNKLNARHCNLFLKFTLKIHLSKSIADIFKLERNIWHALQGIQAYESERRKRQNNTFLLDFRGRQISDNFPFNLWSYKYEQSLKELTYYLLCEKLLSIVVRSLNSTESSQNKEIISKWIIWSMDLSKYVKKK